MPDDQHEHRAARPARAAREQPDHGVVRVTSTTSEIEVAHAGHDQRRRSVSPCAVSPTGWPNQSPSGTTSSPGVTIENVAGSTTIPVKIGMNSQTRLTKKPSGSRDAAASARVTA